MKKERSYIVIIAVTLMCSFYLLFFVYPLVVSILGSFFDWNPLSGSQSFIGLDNYSRMISDPLFSESLYNTFYFAICVVIGRVGLGLLIALALYSIKRYQEVLRTMYFLPVIMPMVSVALVWEWMYDPRIGLINMFLAAFGVVGPNWLTDAGLAMNSVIIMTVWKDLGYAVIILMAGLLNVDNSQIEAAQIDGAKYWQVVRKILIPSIKPTLIFVLITSVISYFQAFTQIFIMTEGGPGSSTHVLAYLIYNSAFKNFEFGYASALATTLFVIIMIITFIQFKIIGGRDE
ncbi:sugar ABC transporter permease [Mollicutes bacterium LVI A0039]|nr:sugar ABC transporter permease [Mollicutes bacterium LVI A0039]